MLDSCPEVGRSPGPDDPDEGMCSRDMAKSLQISVAGNETMACLIEMRVDDARTVPPKEFLNTGQRFRPSCQTLCHHALAAEQRMPPRTPRATSRHHGTAKTVPAPRPRLHIQNCVKDNAPFTIQRDYTYIYRMGTTVPALQLRDAAGAS